MELHKNDYQGRELLEAGFSVMELVQAGIKGKALRDLGCPLGDVLEGAWLGGRASYLNELFHIAMEWEYVTERNVGVMRTNLREGHFTDAYYAAMWEDRLEVPNPKVVKVETGKTARVAGKEVPVFDHVWEDEDDNTPARALLDAQVT